MTEGESADRELLDRFGLITEESLAKLLGVTVKTLKSRLRDDLPRFVKKGHRRLFVEASVREFMGLPEAAEAKHDAPAVEYASRPIDPELSNAIDEAAREASRLADKLLNIQRKLKRRG